MKRIICSIIFFQIALNVLNGQVLPSFINQRLDSIRIETQKSLSKFRIWDSAQNGDITLPIGLGFYSSARIVAYYYSQEVFSYKETHLIDSLKLNLTVGMIYDDSMRNRIVQLIKNEFTEWELDSLANRNVNYEIKSNESEAMKICKFDTMQVFKVALDSFYLNLQNKKEAQFTKKTYHYQVFKLLKLDTTELFRQTYDKVLASKIKIKREKLLNNTFIGYEIIHLVDICGYVNDQRFVQPLIDLLNKPFNNEQIKRIIEEKTITALFRLKIEPYYSSYIKKRTRTIKEIQNEAPNFEIEDLVYIIGTQKSFLELSKYLLSDYQESFSVIDYKDHSDYIPSPIWYKALILIQENIENSSLQKIIENVSDWRTNKQVKDSVYDWMQKNYGKYKIRRIW
jgi:hypothetical protein